MLAEFKYGPEVKETFAWIPFLGDQATPRRCVTSSLSRFGGSSKLLSRRLYYHLKKDLFPWAYWGPMLQGKWFGASGLFRPKFR